jgi:hypothetical protein
MEHRYTSRKNLGAGTTSISDQSPSSDHVALRPVRPGRQPDQRHHGLMHQVAPCGCTVKTAMNAEPSARRRRSGHRGRIGRRVRYAVQRMGPGLDLRKPASNTAIPTDSTPTSP